MQRFFKLTLSFILLALGTSCTTVQYSHPYTVEKLKKVDQSDLVVYEFSSEDLGPSFKYSQNKDLEISYDLWNKDSKTGDIFYTAKIENLTNNPLYIDLSQSSLIANGYSYNYRAFVNSNSSNYIPPHSHIIIAINPELGMEGKKNTSMLSDIRSQNKGNKAYTSSNSPFIFRNVLTYSEDRNLNNSYTIDNKFWVSEISIINGDWNISSLEKNNRTYTKYNYSLTEEYVDTHYNYTYKSVPNWPKILMFAGAGVIVGVLLLDNVYLMP